MRASVFTLIGILVAGCVDATEEAQNIVGPDLGVVPGGDCALGVLLDEAREIVDALTEELNTLEAEATLERGQAVALLTRLHQGIRHANGGRWCNAVARVEAFRDRVLHLIERGALTHAEAEPLLDGVGRLLHGALPGTGFATIDVGSGQTCAVAQDGDAYCWGRNNGGQLGDGTTTDRLVPTPVSGGIEFALIQAANSFTCALGTGGTPYCWGSNWEGQLGGGTFFQLQLLPAPVPGGHELDTISTREGVTCGLASGDQDLICWGALDQFEGAAPPERPETGDVEFATVSTGFDFICGLDAAGTAYCWGYIELGTGDTGFRARPTPVSGDHEFVALSSGYGHACALEADGDAYCWGENVGGALGDGTTERRLVPTRVAGGHAFVAISAGSYTCALDRGGEAYCWGANIQGQLGDGTTERRLTPTPVAGEHNFTAISTGSQHTCALELDGRALCWGANRSGQLGDGTTTDRLIPTPVVDPEGAGEG